MLLYFAVTLFLSSALLFLVQPMIGKMILPRLGGTPAVWNTCMVFFQAVLLVGYGYTHTVSTWPDRRRQILLHGVVLLLPFLALPFSVGAWQPPSEENPVFHVLWLLLGLVGLPFFVVATSAPLLQKWFAGTGHPAAKDPYFLYGASNLGSMLALLAYPLLVEPIFPLDSQAALWTVSYAVLVVLVLGCALLVWKLSQVDPVLAVPSEPALSLAAVAEPSTSIRPGRAAFGRRRRGSSLSHKTAAPPLALVHKDAVTPLRRLRWIGLAAAPSSLMLGVTTYLTTDIAAIPFFWVLPLALYLLTFILVFTRWPVRWTQTPHTSVLYLQPFILLALVFFVLAKLDTPNWLEFFLHMLVFLATALVCHGELAKDRPSPQYLTEFYLWMSVGGVLGGMFNALVAPMVFYVGVIEYPLALLLACYLRPPLTMGSKPLIGGDSMPDRPTALGQSLDVLAAVAVGGLTYLSLRYGFSGKLRQFQILIPVIVCLLTMGRPLRFGLSLSALMLVAAIHDRSQQRLAYESRSFYGFLRVREEEDSEGDRYYALIHGGINHGWQSLDPERRRELLTYFHPKSGISQLFGTLSWPDARLPASLVGLGATPFGPLVGIHSEPPYAVVGLGIGTLAAHARPYQHVTFYEIDPAVIHLSKPPPGSQMYFTYIHDAEVRGADVEIIPGDGRLSLRSAPERYYHVLVLDAFSSDAIPVHLLTAQAIDLYLKKLADGGVLIFNTTNRYVDIRPVLADLARSRDLVCLAFGDWGDKENPTSFGSDWVVMQRRLPASGPTGSTFNGGLRLDRRDNFPHWDVPEGLGGRIWTDDYSNLLRVLHW